MALYIGTNYHPHDWDEERWKIDIDLMKKAGFTTVRLGHLCWDSYEPEEGVYTFGWFDRVMDLFAAAGIGVVLDISMRPAPVWVHKLCPGADIFGKGQTMQASLRRYMEDVEDPAYQHYALRFAKILVNRYKKHRALFAFGLCNEIGDGYISHSEYARRRFANWLKKKYGTIDRLNDAWATRRWSRRLTSFDDVYLPENEIAVGAPESRLDMRRFFSDGIGRFFVKLKEVVAENAPGVPHSSNHYAEKGTLGFDYLKVCDLAVDYPGIGVYPEYEVGKYEDDIMVTYQQRLAETGKPMWCLEFQTGSGGVYCGPYGVNRMHVFQCLLHRAQMILGWTWRSMLGGEEQYLYGLMGHDGTPTPNYEEYRQIASELNKLQEYAFPYLPDPEIGVAYNYDSDWIAQHSRHQYRQPYHENIKQVHRVLDGRNTDYNIVDLRNIKKHYKLLIIPGHIMMTQQMADTVRNYVKAGGTAIMTGYSGMVDETGKVFGTPRPGYLTDVFGMRIAGFERLDALGMHQMPSYLAGGETGKHEMLEIRNGKKQVKVRVDYYEYLELKTARSFAEIVGKNRCAVSVNQYGKGKAYYIASEANEELVSWLLEQVEEEVGLKRYVKTPKGVCARKIAETQTFYLNMTNDTVEIQLESQGNGVLTERTYEKAIQLRPYDGELIISSE